VLPDVGSVPVLLGKGDGTFPVARGLYGRDWSQGSLGNIKFRDYLAYVLISHGVVGAVLLIALYEAHKAR
jgi:hypothetical protein